ncbi:hypothetical protein [Streptomyces marincola]|uniref:hypothetical protein n=1 Tax=Streptomyces marincola TaxID=2878388 RepID=UPI001CF3BED3|nr:hypothetical protein [Streptomyces marincola]UCM89731.1 hypothetical protein LC193_18205 [Streptomyces marincola]
MVQRSAASSGAGGDAAGYLPVLVALIGGGAVLPLPIEQGLRAIALAIVIVVIVLHCPWWRPGRGDACQPAM